MSSLRRTDPEPGRLKPRGQRSDPRESSETKESQQAREGWRGIGAEKLGVSWPSRGRAASGGRELGAFYEVRCKIRGKDCVQD